MPYRSMLLSAALVILLASSARGQSASEQGSRPTFRVGVDVVSLNVTVTDGTHHFVGDLVAGDFTILEDGVRQKVSYFHKPDLPLAVALLIDTSASMEDKLPMAQAGATGFAHQLAPADVASVIAFDSRVTILQEFTSDATALERAIHLTVRAPGVPARGTAGGRAFFPLALGDLAGVYQEIQQELSNQYALAYVSTNPRRDGQWRTISVRISRGDTVARTKQGYYASGTHER